MKEIELKIVINSISLGINRTNDPKKDRKRYLTITDFDVRIGDKGYISINPEGFKIEEFKVSYCDECLKEGRRNKHYYSSSSEGWTLCKKHYRERFPAQACPKCDTGVMRSFCCAACGKTCSDCGHGEGGSRYDFSSMKVIKNVDEK